MSRPCTDMNNFSIACDYTGTTSDLLLGRVEELEHSASAAWRAKGFPAWPTLVAEDVAAFEDADLVDLTPSSLEIESPVPGKIFFVTYTTPEKADRFSTYFTIKTTTSPDVLVDYCPKEAFSESRFFPDFYEIKRVVSQVFSYASSVLGQKEELQGNERNIPIEIAPEVVREAEERGLTADLETSIRLAQESYLKLYGIHVTIEHDPEIAGRTTVHFTLIVSGEPDTVLEYETAFKKCLRTDVSRPVRELVTVGYRWKS